MKSRALLMLTFAIASATRPAIAAGWSVQKNEQDPFDKSKATFIAGAMGGGEGLAIRCLEGTISLLVIAAPSNASLGDTVDLRIVADDKAVQEEDAQVLGSTTFATSVQFGDSSTLDYLQGTQKISLRYTLAGATSTVSFSGGRSLNDVIARARKACGLLPSEAPKATQPVQQKAAQPTDARNETCEAQFDRMKKSGDLGPDPDEHGFLTWCTNQATTKP
jgi:hypothetical protein